MPRRFRVGPILGPNVTLTRPCCGCSASSAPGTSRPRTGGYAEGCDARLVTEDAADGRAEDDALAGGRDQVNALKPPNGELVPTRARQAAAALESGEPPGTA